MSKSGRKGSHLRLVDAVASVEDAPDSRCGGRTTRGGVCQKPPGQGTEHPGKGQCRHHDGQVEEGDPCPLPLNPLERRLWDQVTDQLQELRLYNVAFWPHIYGLVVALAGLHVARQSAKIGEVVKGDNSTWKKHPSSTVVNQMLAQIRQFSNDLGLNPSALAAADLGIDPNKPLSRMEELIRGRR
jgi:phage terminase small subunit